MGKTKNWWLKKDCRKCRFYPKCDAIELGWKEAGLTFPRGCSEYQELTLQVQEVRK